MKKSLPFLTGFAATVVFLSMVASPQAAPVTLLFSPVQSRLTLNGQAFGLAYNPQTVGADVCAFGGGIYADLTGGVLTFSGGGSIVASAHPMGPFSTAPAPYPPGGDNYGMTGSGFVTGYGLVTFNGAYRYLTFDITSGTVADGVPVAGMNLALTSGQVDWGATTGLGPTGGSSSLVGVTGPNVSLDNVFFDGTKLIIPVDLTTTGANRVEHWVGTLVAFVPEPSALGLAMLGLGAFVARSARRNT